MARVRRPKLQGSHAFGVNWDRKFNRHRPAMPQPPCSVCSNAESLSICMCGAPLCDDCADGGGKQTAEPAGRHESADAGSGGNRRPDTPMSSVTGGADVAMSGTGTSDSDEPSVSDAMRPMPGDGPRPFDLRPA